MIELSWFYLCWLWPVLLLFVNASLLCLFASLFACFLSLPCILRSLLTSSLHWSAYRGCNDAWDEPAHEEGGLLCSALLLVVWAHGSLFLLLWSLQWGNTWPEQGQQESSHGGQRAGMKRRQMAQIPFKNTLRVMELPPTRTHFLIQSFTTLESTTG